jgi:hypothetical protein
MHEWRRFVMISLLLTTRVLTRRQAFAYYGTARQINLGGPGQGYRCATVVPPNNRVDTHGNDFYLFVAFRQTNSMDSLYVSLTNTAHMPKCLCASAAECTEFTFQCATGACTSTYCVQTVLAPNTPCVDNNACTGPDFCQASGVCAGDWSSCDDGNLCTVDSCSNITGGCLHVLTNCDDGKVRKTRAPSSSF